MDIRKVAVQAAAGAILYTVILVILEKNYSQQVWLEKGVNGLIFGVVYGVFIVARQKFFNKK